MSGEAVLEQYRSRIDARLEQLLPSSDTSPADLHRAIRYSVLGAGKRIRPALAMATAKAFGADPEIGLDAGCATELVHCFSLIHDDLPAIDNDELRRGRATSHKVFGEAIAILAGDALFALAFDVLASAFPASSQPVLILARASGSAGLVGGEVLDIQAEGRVGSFDLLRTIHQRKTGALISAACELGAIAAGAGDDRCASARRFGELVGLGFQVADDVLNETGCAETLGKAVGSDSARQKLTYPALIGLEESRREATRLIAEACDIMAPLGEQASDLIALAQYATKRQA